MILIVMIDAMPIYSFVHFVYQSYAALVLYLIIHYHYLSLSESMIHNSFELLRLPSLPSALIDPPPSLRRIGLAILVYLGLDAYLR